MVFPSVCVFSLELTIPLAALVLAQVSGPSEDRAVVTGARKYVETARRLVRTCAHSPRTYSFARSLGGAIGLAVSNTLLNNVFLKDLPASIPASVRQQLQAEFVLSPSMSAEVQGQILDAYMAGMRDVFIFFTPVVGVCLVMCFFIKVRSASPLSR